jgi:hypothetical protein
MTSKERNFKIEIDVLDENLDYIDDLNFIERLRDSFNICAEGEDWNERILSISIID